DGDRFESAQGADERLGRIVEQGDTVPQHIAVSRLQQQRALADTELRLGVDFEQAGLQSPPRVDVSAAELFRSSPTLSAGRHELAFIVANRAAGRRLGRV